MARIFALNDVDRCYECKQIPEFRLVKTSERLASGSLDGKVTVKEVPIDCWVCYCPCQLTGVYCRQITHDQAARNWNVMNRIRGRGRG